MAPAASLRTFGPYCFFAWLCQAEAGDRAPAPGWDWMPRGIRTLSSKDKPLEEVLVQAAGDQTFGDDLMDDRLGALEARGISLSEQDQVILLSVPDQQLRASLDGLFGQDQLAMEHPPPEVFTSQGIRPDHLLPVGGCRSGRLFIATAATAAVVGGGIAYCSHGVRPDSPPEQESAAVDQGEPAKDAGPE